MFRRMGNSFFETQVLGRAFSAALQVPKVIGSAAKAGWTVGRNRDMRAALFDDSFLSGGIGGAIGKGIGIPLGLVSGTAYELGRPLVSAGGRVINRDTARAVGQGLREQARITGLAAEGAYDLGKRALSRPATRKTTGFRALNREWRPSVIEAAIPVAVVGGAGAGAASHAANPMPAMPYHERTGMPGAMNSFIPTPARAHIDDLGATGDLVFALHNRR